jgi:hypothetical protein
MEKPVDDIDLISVVRDILYKSGLQVLTTANYDSHPLIISSIGKISSVQRFNLNRYWSLQLMSVDKYSEEERYCLIPNGSNDDWLSLFSHKVIPFIIENNLPKAL